MTSTIERLMWYHHTVVIGCLLALLGQNNLGEALNYFGVLWVLHFVVLRVVVGEVLLLSVRLLLLSVVVSAAAL